MRSLSLTQGLAVILQVQVPLYLNVCPDSEQELVLEKNTLGLAKFGRKTERSFPILGVRPRAEWGQDPVCLIF